jgi:hypothetical protein
MRTDLIKRGIKDPKSAAWYILDNKILPYVRSASIFTTSRYPIGTLMFEEDWDLLIILDACRADALQEIKDEYGFLTDVEQRWSAAGHSAEWIAKNFDRKWTHDISKTAYVTANPHSETVFENRFQHFKDSSDEIEMLNRFGDFDVVIPEEIGLYDPIWKSAGFREEDNYDLYGSPRALTDRLIEVGRNSEYDRTIGHYMPPHTPYIINARRENRKAYHHEENPIKYLRETGDYETVYAAYLDMIRWVLDEVSIVLENVDKEKVVITADHADAFGEYALYGHRAGSLHPKIRTVPWARTTATDSGTYEPNFGSETTKDESLEERLEALGYL